jgi:hypothetical protein
MAGRGVRAALAGAGSCHRVLRGGAFNNNERNVRCAYRNRNNPQNENRNNGFRLVLAHVFLQVRHCRAGIPFPAEARKTAEPDPGRAG